MLETKENNVKVEGILSEIDLKDNTYTKDGKQVESVGGSIKVRVTQKINGVETELEVPVHLFSTKYTKAGKLNPAYESICQVKDKFVSIAAAGIDEADRIRITGAEIRMNEYYSQDGRLVSFPRITASFVKKIKKEECNPTATFSIIFYVGSKGFELDKDGVETDKYKFMAAVPRFGGKVDVIPFYAINKGVIDAVSGYWNEGDTVKALGVLNFSSKTETKLVEVDFGEPQEQTRTVSVSELIITGGVAAPMEGEFAFNAEDIKAALAERNNDLAALKEKAANTPKKGTAPAANKGGFAALGF